MILGGTTEARRLAEALQGKDDIAPILSLAGRTQNPTLPQIPYRIGGFGGIDGLIAYLRAEEIGLVIDATHPFAEQMSAHAEAACRATGTALVAFSRPPWIQQDGDRWREADTAAGAAKLLGDTPRRVFLTVGRLQLPAFETAPIHDYLIRSIDLPEPVPNLPRHRVILARGPFSLEDEMALMRGERIDVLVTKNSGGDATYAKIAAARELGLPVILMRQPQRPDVPMFHSLDEILRFIGEFAHQNSPLPRGV